MERMRNPLLLAAFTLVFVALSQAMCGFSRAEAAETSVVRVAAAGDLKFALDEVIVALHRQHPDIEIRVSYGSSGNFYAQLSNRAPFDVFFSADLDYPRRLIRDGLALPETEFKYGV